MIEQAAALDALACVMGAGAGLREESRVIGHYTFICRDADGNVLWEDGFDNLITTVGKNFMLDTTLAGSAYTVVGPYLGLISSTSYSAIVVGDTMASHAGWLEAGGANGPTMSSARLTGAFSAASAGSKTLSAGLVYTFTGGGTVQGAFLVLGSGAVSTKDSTAGTLYSAGTLTTAQPVISGNTLTVSYSSTLT